jgi:hypothetical protein
MLLIGLGLAAAPARAQQPPYPGAGYSAPVNNAALVRVLLTDVKDERRVEAARLLGASGDPKVIQALSTAAVEDQDPRVRQAATEALRQLRDLCGGGTVPAPPAPAWPPLGPPVALPVVQPTPVVQPPVVVQPPIVVQPAPVVVRPPPDPQIELVQAWYQRYLRRSIDIAGLQGWVTLLRQGASHDDIKAAMLGSPEYYRLHGGIPTNYVIGLYGDVLGRSPNELELALWVNRLVGLRNDRTRLAADFLRASQAELHRHPAHGHYPLR